MLAKHGLFTFGDDARTAYERTIELVTRAERHVAVVVDSAADLPEDATATLVSLPSERWPIVRTEAARGHQDRCTECNRRQAGLRIQIMENCEIDARNSQLRARFIVACDERNSQLYVRAWQDAVGYFRFR